MKKKRDDMKMILRILPAHKKLHSRMEQVRKFRRQHEQLRSVIERVLRPDQQTMVEGNAHEVSWARLKLVNGNIVLFVLY